MLTVGRLRAAVDEGLRDAAGQPVVVGLAAVTYLGSHGLVALAEAASKAERRREPLRLVLALYCTVEEALPQ